MFSFEYSNVVATTNVNKSRKRKNLYLQLSAGFILVGLHSSVNAELAVGLNNTNPILNTNGNPPISGSSNVGSLNGSNNGSNTNTSNGGTGSQGGSINLNTGGTISNTSANGSGGAGVNIGNNPSFANGGIVSSTSILTIQSQAQAFSGVQNNLNMMMHGAHSRPLSHLVPAGEKTVWVAGDTGRDDHGSRSGDTGLAEINVGHNLGLAQINLTIGQTWANQSMALGGRLNADGQYLMFEAIVPILAERKLYAVLGGFGHWGNADVRRGYMNAGSVVASKGNTDTETYGVRARLEWLDSQEIAGVQLSPYADISYVKTHMDGYDEKNGPVNISFNSQKDDNTTLRLGFNAIRPISNTRFNWVANFEAAHAFNDKEAAISGAIAGTAFRVSSTSNTVQNDWVKAGVGVEGIVANGKGSLMLNGTTSSGLPNAWLAASYQLSF